jgi:hypothetical protein
MTEADYEYLLYTLSEARSRANEIATAVRSRVGVGHRLTELGNSAVFQIEALLREIRRVATDESEAAPTREVRSRLPVQSSASVESTISSLSAAAPATQGMIASEHWFPVFINDLLQAFQSSGRISFETVESLLHERKEAFVKELEITRKMYRTYPYLFREKDIRIG